MDTTLGQLIREALDGAGDEPDFDEVAKHVVSQIDDEDIPDIILGLVRQRVLTIAHKQRQWAFSNCAPERQALPGAGPPRHGSQLAWERWLNVIVCIDEKDPNSHKRLRVCTLADVRAVIGNRKTKAREFTAEANRFTKLAELMVTQNAATVGDLPPATLESLAQGWRS